MRAVRKKGPLKLMRLILTAVGKVADWVALSSAVVLGGAIAFAGQSFYTGRRLRGALGLGLAGLAGVGVYARFVEPYRLRVRRLRVDGQGVILAPASNVAPRPVVGDPPSDSARLLTLCFFSDLHVGRFRRADWVRRIVELANAQQPNVVLIGGDFVGHLDGQRLEDLLAPLGDLRAPGGVYAILGNHDYGLPGDDVSVELERIFGCLGVRLLRNECVALSPRVRLVATDELWADLADPARAFAACATCGDCDDCGPECTTIFLGHNPDLMSRIHHRAALFLFGHTHAGQIHIPAIPGFGIPVEGKLYRGLYELPQGCVYVSSGCGETSTPTRLGTRPEIVVVTVG